MAGDALILLPSEDVASQCWLRVAAGGIVARGMGYPVAAEDEMVALVIAAADVALHPAAYDDLAPAQARAAAQLAAADLVIAPLETLHIAAGDGIAVIARGRMMQLLEKAQTAGFDPDVVIPAPLLLPVVDNGYVRASVGDEVVLRGQGLGFGDDAALTPLLTGGAPIVHVTVEALERAIVDAVRAPAINLRQGLFARRRAWKVLRPKFSRIARLAAAIGVFALMIPLVTITRLNQQSNALEQETALTAQSALGGSVKPEDATAKLEAALADLRGGGAGFLPTANAVVAAVEATANVELVGATFDPDGALRVTARATSPAELTALQQRLRDDGFTIVAGPITSNQGQPLIDLQVRGL
jgi:general secretion pathway protein L